MVTLGSVPAELMPLRNKTVIHNTCQVSTLVSTSVLLRQFHNVPCALTPLVRMKGHMNFHNLLLIIPKVTLPSPTWSNSRNKTGQTKSEWMFVLNKCKNHTATVNLRAASIHRSSQAQTTANNFSNNGWSSTFWTSCLFNVHYLGSLELLSPIFRAYWCHCNPQTIDISK